MLNGVALNDAQTGHYTLNLPLSTELIERVEVLQGTSASLSGAFSGAINIVTRKGKKDDQSAAKGLSLKLTAGMNGLVNPELAASLSAGKTQINLSADYNRADGYYAPSPGEKEQTALHNSDYKQANLYAQVRWQGLMYRRARNGKTPVWAWDTVSAARISSTLPEPLSLRRDILIVWMRGE